MTLPERKVWNHLKDRAVADAKFRRQHPIGPYVADFFCAEVGLVVEIDGQTHLPARDVVRDAYMAALGLVVLRIPVSLLERDVFAAIESIGRKVRLLREQRAVDSSRPLA